MASRRVGQNVTEQNLYVPTAGTLAKNFNHEVFLELKEN